MHISKQARKQASNCTVCGNDKRTLHIPGAIDRRPAQCITQSPRERCCRGSRQPLPPPGLGFTRETILLQLPQQQYYYSRHQSRDAIYCTRPIFVIDFIGQVPPWQPIVSRLEEKTTSKNTILCKLGLKRSKSCFGHILRTRAFQSEAEYLTLTLTCSPVNTHLHKKLTVA